MLALPQAPEYDELIQLARRAVKAEVEGKPLPTPTTKSAPLPVFVTIERGAKVLGCRGSLTVRTATLEQEVILAARSAAMHDPRYGPIKAKDLLGFKVTVTLIRGLESIDSVAGIGPEDGIVLRSGEKAGIVLPWEGKDPQVRLEWAYKKAGVPLGTNAKLFRLKGERFRG